MSMTVKWTNNTICILLLCAVFMPLSILASSTKETSGPHSEEKAEPHEHQEQTVF
jgi:hypothetical protein